jgi:anti-sigma factor RsiW
MTCRELAEHLLEYVAGELAADQRAYLEEHLRDCPPCVVYLETYELTIRITRRLPPCEPLPPDLEQRLRAALGQPPSGAA